MWVNAKWIGLPAEEIREKKIYQGDMNGRFVYFRHSFCLKEKAGLTVDISANSRYRFWVNGHAVQSGPCRGDRYRQYYETIDVSDFLCLGENVLAVQVLLCDSSYVPKQQHRRAPLISVAGLPAGHRLAMEGEIFSDEGKPLGTVTTGEAQWNVFLDDSFYLTAEPVVSDNLGASVEVIDLARVPVHWKRAGFDDTDWRAGEIIEPVVWGEFEKGVGLYLNYNMKERPIPLLLEEEQVLEREVGEGVFGSEEKIILQPYTTRKIMFGLAALENTYPIYQFEKGKGTKVSFTYFEKFINAAKQIKRDDWAEGEIGGNGLTDTVYLNGDDVTYEPFWYRSFRFLEIKVQTGEEEVVIFRPKLHKTGYPLKAKSHVSSSEKWVEQLYQMCVHTLEGCMTDAYMDCPFWEQMQYPMDTRLQAMFTYVCSTDTALARKALEDFHCSIIPEGLVLGKAPTGYLQVISTFSFYYIFMIWDYYERTGDAGILLKYRSDVDGILEYFAGKIDGSGLVADVEYWSFVDWQESWGKTLGRPEAVAYGPSTIINLMYGSALLAGARIQEASGRAALAAEYRERQKEICTKIQEKCWDGTRKMYCEGPGFSQYTQHAQSWAVLNGMVKGKEAAELMRRTFEEEDVLRCYFSTCYELFRACEMAGCYELTRQQMEWWIRLIGEHCTTCPETPNNARSECHAWSALPMYELLGTMAGIRPGKPGRQSIVICPHMEYLPDLTGGMVTEWGMLEFDYSRAGEEWRYEFNIPEGCSAFFKTLDGELIPLHLGKQTITEHDRTGHPDNK